MSKKYKFKTDDRLLLLAALPPQGDIATLRILHELKQALSFTEKENKALDLNTDAKGMVTYCQIAASKMPDKAIDIGEKAMDVIVECLKMLDKRKKLTLHYLPLWDRFVEKKGN